jgi:hypothetical protein
LESNPRLLNSSNAAGSRTSLSLSDGMFAFRESFKAICTYVQLTTPKLTKSGPNKPKTPEFSFSRIHAPTTHDWQLVQLANYSYPKHHTKHSQQCFLVP